MTDTATPPAAPPAAPAPQVIDVAKITADATRAATEAAQKIANESARTIAAEKLSEIGRALSGQEQPDAVNPLLRGLVNDPAGTLHGLKELAKREMREETAATTQANKVVYDAVQPFVNEYPQLTGKKLVAVERYAADNMSNGMSPKEAYETACKDAVSEFGLKSVSEAQKDGSYVHHGLPGGGGAGSNGNPKITEAQSNQSFIEGMRNRMTSFRKRT